MSPLTLSSRFLLASEHSVLSKVGNGRFSELSENIVLTALCLLKAAGLFTWAGVQLCRGRESWSQHQGCLAIGLCHAAKFQTGLEHKYPFGGFPHDSLALTLSYSS